jgi:23S rRNA pseudouridine1911/1915/1917 synthase
VPDSEPIQWLITAERAGTRLDVFLAQELPDYSRTFLRRMIDTDAVRVDDRRAKVAYRLIEGQRVSFQPVEVPRGGPVPEDIPLDVIFEDEHLVAINKPPGMVVHPARGHWSGTLASALSFHFQQLSSVGGPSRPGIVHRLDRDTSGVIVVAKTDAAHMKLAAQFEARTTEKEYFAIVLGAPDRDRDEIDEPIGPHPSAREKMAIRRDHSNARKAVTFYEVDERFDRFATLRVTPKTGRTHQIRIHLNHIGHPVLCDRLYGGRASITRGDLSGDLDATVVLDRQALHAQRLALSHPATGETVEFVAPMPTEIAEVLKILRSRI